MDVFGWDYWECDTNTGMRKLVGRNDGERYFSYEKAYNIGWFKAAAVMELGPLSYFREETRLNLNGYIADVRVFKERVPVATNLDMIGLVLVFGLQKYFFARYLKDLCSDCANLSKLCDSHNLHVLHRERVCPYDYSLIIENHFGTIMETFFQEATLDVLFEENKHMYPSNKVDLFKLKTFLVGTFLTSPAFKYERFMLKAALKQQHAVATMYRNNFVTVGMLDTLPHVRSALFVRHLYE